jgi:muconolactone delta-isomerase
MEFLVEFNVTVPAGTQDAEVKEREQAEAAAAGDLFRAGHSHELDWLNKGVLASVAGRGAGRVIYETYPVA